MKVATKYVLWLAENLLGAFCLWKIKREVAAQHRRPKASSTSTFLPVNEGRIVWSAKRCKRNML